MSILMTVATAAGITLKPGQNYTIGKKWKSNGVYYQYAVKYSKNGTAVCHLGTFKNAMLYIKRVR
jgi:hypothetical protein